MYVQITTRCNMLCEHCCFDCTESGEDMSEEVFNECLCNDEIISIGGGEPTLHPKFFKFVMKALSECEYVWLATNGSQTDISLILAGLAKKGILDVALSLDDYHEPIDNEVVHAFTSEKNTKLNKNDSRTINDLRTINDVKYKLINSGRCDFGKNSCCCPDIFVEPNGTVKSCGCQDAPIFGTIFDFEIPIDWKCGECYKIQGR